MKNFGEKIKDSMVGSDILISPTLKLDSKVFAIEEMQDLKNLTVEQLHGIFTTYEIKKGGISGIREAAFKATNKGKEKIKA